jgi:hypothetical protein
VAACVEVTAATVAVNPAVRAPAATVTEAGTVTDELLLLSVTVSPPVGAAELSDTVHESLAAPLIVPFAQETPLSVPPADCPVPLRATTTVPLVAELLEIVIVPVCPPTVAGSKLTCKVADCPGFSVAGNVAPDIEKSVPVSVAEFTVSGAVPDDVSVTVSVVDVLTVTSPKLRLVVLTLTPGVCATSCKA